VRKEKNYFAGHAERMNYKEIADRGWPIGKGSFICACFVNAKRFDLQNDWTSGGRLFRTSACKHSHMPEKQRF
jgi:hypothetical protein